MEVDSYPLDVMPINRVMPCIKGEIIKLLIQNLKSMFLFK